MRVIGFKLRSEYGHFRKHYSTSSPLTHAIPPTSAVRGVIGAIIGIRREEYPEVFSPENCRIGIGVKKRVKKVRMGLNLIDTKDGAWLSRPSHDRLHTQVRFEFLKDPEFEVYFWHKDSKLMDKLSVMLQEHESIYIPFMGISECIANFEFLWDREIEPEHEIEGYTYSAVNVNNLIDIEIEEGTALVKEYIPDFINLSRIREQTAEVIFNPYGNGFQAKVKEGLFYPEKEGEYEFFTFI